jgi:hypothetical protein
MDNEGCAPVWPCNNGEFPPLQNNRSKGLPREKCNEPAKNQVAS